MAYASGDVSRDAYLAGNIVYQTTQRVLDAETLEEEVVVWERGVALLYSVCLMEQADSKDFQEEWARIEAERRQAVEEGFIASVHLEEALSLRQREWNALVRLLQGSGKLRWVEPEETDWNV